MAEYLRPDVYVERRASGERPIASVGTSQPAKEPAEVSDQVEETESATAAALKVCWKPYDAGWPAITHEVSSITSEQA